MDDKVQQAADKTLEALARVGRFLSKYGDMIEKAKLTKIAQKLDELQEELESRVG